MKTREGTTPPPVEASPIWSLPRVGRKPQDDTILVFSEVPLRCRTAVFLFLSTLPVLALSAQEPVAPATASPTPDPARSHTLRWTTKGGATNFAYEVFRAESEAGPFTKVNREFISGHLMYRGQQVQQFSFTDTDIDPAKDYWYYVESINLMQERSRLTPVQKAPAKLKASPTPSR